MMGMLHSGSQVLVHLSAAPVDVGSVVQGGHRLLQLPGLAILLWLHEFHDARADTRDCTHCL
jgi:hypothetical protein